MSKTTAGIALIALGIVGYVVLLLFGGTDQAEQARGIFVFLGPIGAGLFVIDRVDNVGAKADTVIKQTNGLLTKHVEDVADAAVSRSQTMHNAQQTEKENENG